jgi:hypothetical protein
MRLPLLSSHCTYSLRVLPAATLMTQQGFRIEEGTGLSPPRANWNQ